MNLNLYESLKVKITDDGREYLKQQIRNDLYPCSESIIDKIYNNFISNIDENGFTIFPIIDFFRYYKNVLVSAEYYVYNDELYVVERRTN